MKFYLLIFFIFGLFFNMQSQEQVSDTLRLIFLGDIMSHGPQIRAAYNTQTKTYDYSENFEYLFPVFSQADFVIANLETPVGVRPYSGYPAFSAPVELPVACSDVGINVMATANNHACDKGKKGILTTLDKLDSLQIKHFGTYRNATERDSLTPLILQAKNYKIALLNYTYGTNGLPVPYPAKVNLINKKQIIKDIAKAKALHPDLIIAFLHWGIQYKSKPSARQVELARFLHSKDVPVVIGSHPHVLQPIVYQDDNNSQRLVVYSLGNFISNQRKYPRDGSMAVTLKIFKDPQGNIRFLSPEILPLWVYKYKEGNKWHYQILPVNDYQFNPNYFNNNQSYQKMMRFLKYYQKIIQY